MHGFKAAFHGFSLVQHHGIRLFVVLPSLVSILFIAAATWFTFSKVEIFKDLVMTSLPSFLSWFADALTFIIMPVFLITCCYLAILLANIIAAPFNGLLSEKVENILTGYPPPSEGRKIRKFVMVWHIVNNELRKLRYIFLCALLVIFCSFIPVINVVMPVIWLIAGSWLLCVEYMNYPMENHNIPFKQQLSILKKHKMLALGFGCGLLLITAVPVINLFAMPVATCAATRLWVDYFNEQSKK